jgi:hypothetical protein
MALNVGDAVLTFFGDTANLEQAFNKVATEAGEKLGVATTGAVNSATGAIDGMSKSMAVGQQGAVELGEATDLAGDKTRESMYQARGEVGLLVDIFHLDLPRHVRSFIAELPGVGAALSAAFQATAVLFVVSALVEGIKTIAEWAEFAEKMRQAYEKSALAIENLTIKEGDHTKSLELANLKLDDQIAKLELRPDRNKLKEALLETSIAADSLAATFSKDFEKLTEESEKATSFWGQFIQSLYQANRVMSAFGSDIGKEYQKSSEGVEAVELVLKQVHNQMLQINELRVKQAQAKTEEEQIAASKALAEGYRVQGEISEWALRVVQNEAPQNIKLITELSSAVVRSAAAQKDFGLQAEDTAKRVTNAELQQWETYAEFGDKAFKRRAEEWKAATEQEEKTRTDARNKAIADLQEREKEEIAATKQGSEARLTVIDAAIKEEQAKGLQDTAFYKSLLTQRVEAVKFAADAEQKARNKAAEESLKMAQDHAKVETAAVTESYSEQEKAVEKLVSIRYLTQTQGSHQLELLYEAEKNKILKILNDLLKEEQNAVKEAQSKLTAAKLNPFISPEQVAEAERLLNQAQKAVANTQVQISNETKKFQDKELAAAKGFYGQSLALAIAADKADLAERLKANHAALLSAEAQLADAKARGLNTTAIDKQIQELKKLEKELGNDAHRLKDAKSATVEFTEAMKAAYAEEAGAFAAAAEAMITGQESFGQAMEAATFKMLGNIAKHYADMYIAKGLGNIADMNYGAAAEDFVAAAAFEVLAGVMAGLGSNVGKGGGGAGAQGPQVDKNNPNTQVQPNAPQGQNIPHLQGGGLVTTDTLAMIHANEAVIPLNRRAMDMIGEAISKHMQEAGGGSFIVNVKGLISADTLGKTMKKMSRQVQTGRAGFLAKNSLKTTRRA